MGFCIKKLLRLTAIIILFQDQTKTQEENEEINKRVFNYPNSLVSHLVPFVSKNSINSLLLSSFSFLHIYVSLTK